MSNRKSSDEESWRSDDYEESMRPLNGSRPVRGKQTMARWSRKNLCFGLLFLIFVAAFVSLNASRDVLPASSPLVAQLDSLFSTQPDTVMEKKHLVYGSATKQDLSWMGDLVHDYELINYVSDNSTEYTVATSTGREALAYLTYIVDHYHSLPEHIVFFHGAFDAWHQPEPFPYVLKALDFSVVDKLGYVNLRCANEPACTFFGHKQMRLPTDPNEKPRWIQLAIRAIWRHVYLPDAPWTDNSLPMVSGMRIPETFADSCCAQFAVNRRAILAKPLEFWQRVREPLLMDLSEWILPGVETEELDLWRIGAGYEQMWHYLMGRNPINCHDESFCWNTLYQGRIQCDIYTKNWNDHAIYKEKVHCNLTDKAPEGGVIPPKTPYGWNEQKWKEIKAKEKEAADILAKQKAAQQKQQESKDKDAKKARGA